VGFRPFPRFPVPGTGIGRPCNLYGFIPPGGNNNLGDITAGIHKPPVYNAVTAAKGNDLFLIFLFPGKINTYSADSQNGILKQILVIPFPAGIDLLNNHLNLLQM
jgi:hypothetical protein